MLTVHHPWHGAHYGEKAPKVINALIEIPQGSRAKYEVDKETGLLSDSGKRIKVTKPVCLKWMPVE